MRTLVIVLGGQAMASMDGSILTVAAPSLRDDLHASDGQLQLVVAMYVLAFAALVVTGARLGDVLGRRRAFLLGLAGFAAASLAGGLAPSPGVLIAARAAQGAAGALMTPQVLAIIQDEYAGEARARAIGAYSLILAVGVAAGQVAGGALVGAGLLDDAWRPALLINAPLGLVLLVAARRGLPETAPEPGRRLDIGGAALLAAALLALVLPLTLGRDGGWPAWVWPCLLAAGAAFAGFALLERDRPDPVLQLAVLRVPGVAAGVAAVAVLMGCYAGFLFAVTLHLQEDLGFTPLASGLTFAAYAAGFATASLGWSRVGPSARERLPVAGALLMAAALAAVGAASAAAHGAWPSAVMLPLLFAGGVGHACGFSPLTARLTATIAPRHAADLSGLVLTASLVGSVLGTAALGGVYLAAGLPATTTAAAVALAVTVALGARRAAAEAPAVA